MQLRMWGQEPCTAERVLELLLCDRLTCYTAKSEVVLGSTENKKERAW